MKQMHKVCQKQILPAHLLLSEESLSIELEDISHRSSNILLHQCVTGALKSQMKHQAKKKHGSNEPVQFYIAWNRNIESLSSNRKPYFWLQDEACITYDDIIPLNKI